MDSAEPLVQTIRQLEERLLQPDVRHSPGELEKYLAEEFVEYGSTGRVYDRQAIIDELGSESALRFSLTDFKLQMLSPEIALATYCAVCDDGASGDKTHSRRSSLWKKTGDQWQIVFHQGTLIPEV